MWTTQTTGVEVTLFGVSFSSVTEGLAVGLEGVILKTADGGKTWQQIIYEDPDKRALFDVRLMGNIGIAVGDAGKLLGSTDKGKTWSQLPLPADMQLLWFRSAALAKTEKGFRGVVTGRESVGIITENTKVKTVGYLPDVKPTQ